MALATPPTCGPSVAAALACSHIVVAPDLREMGLSSYPEGGREKTKQARDIAAVMDALKVDKADLVTSHMTSATWSALRSLPDIRKRATKWVVIDAALPGIGPWDDIVKSPMLWRFNFRGPDVEWLVAGRERIQLNRFWNELLANPKAIDEATLRALRQALRAPRRDAFGVQPVRGLQSGRCR
jgi:pimeloyl-ACP methyl ester carboxylesterase